MNQTLIKAFLLCSLSWISVSGSESQTVEVQAGGDATLMCSGLDRYDSVRYWLKVVKGTDIQCVSVITSLTSNVKYPNGSSGDKFTMSYNISTMSLKVRSVELNDSGIYYCGFNRGGCPVLTTIHLKVKGSSDAHNSMNNNGTRSNETDECRDRMDRNSTTSSPDKTLMDTNSATLATMILGGLTFFLVIIIIGLSVKIRKLQTAAEEKPNPGHTENEASGELNYAAVTFRSQAKRREPEPNVLYAATR